MKPESSCFCLWWIHSRCFHCQQLIWGSDYCSRITHDALGADWGSVHSAETSGNSRHLGYFFYYYCHDNDCSVCVCYRQLLHTLASMMFLLLCSPVEPEEHVCLLPPAGSSQNCVLGWLFKSPVSTQTNKQTNKGILELTSVTAVNLPTIMIYTFLSSPQRDGSLRDSSLQVRSL